MSRSLFTIGQSTRSIVDFLDCSAERRHVLMADLDSRYGARPFFRAILGLVRESRHVPDIDQRTGFRQWGR